MMTALQGLVGLGLDIVPATILFLFLFTLQSRYFTSEEDVLSG